MATVPNWIPRALILTPSRNGQHGITATTGYRATNTQVVVSTGRGERRFYLDTLTEVGDKSRGDMKVRLVAPDDDRVATAGRLRTISKARNAVISAYEKQRFQDSGVTAEELARKLTELQDATARALAMLSEAL